MYVGDKESSSRTAYSNGKLIYKSDLMMLPTALQCIVKRKVQLILFFFIYLIFHFIIISIYILKIPIWIPKYFGNILKIDLLEITVLEIQYFNNK